MYFTEAVRSILKNVKIFFGCKRDFSIIIWKLIKENLLTELRIKMDKIYRVLVAWQNCVMNTDIQHTIRK